MLLSFSLQVPSSAANLFPHFSSVKDTAAAATVADGALKAVVQTAFDLHHLNSMPAWQLHQQLVELDLLVDDKEEKEEKDKDEKDKDKPKVLSPYNVRVMEALVETLVAAGRDVALGFGCHFGWAIEGAIGSAMKIDASYLSPHVNTASRLEAATKQLRTPLLMSGIVRATSSKKIRTRI